MPTHPLSPEKMDWFCRNVLTELAVYRQVIATGSAERAHTTLIKSRQSVSQSMRKLERSLAQWLNGDVLTIHRHSRQIQPTDAGMLVSHFAGAVQDGSESFLGDLYGLEHGSEVRLACIHSGWMAYGAALNAQFAKRVSNGSISVQTIGGPNYMGKLLAEVQERRADVAITSYPPRVRFPLVLQPLLDRRLVLVFSSRYPKLPREKGPINLARVISDDDKLKIAVHRRSAESPLGDQVVYYLKRRDAHFGDDQLFQVENIAEIKASIERFPQMISILPEDAVATEVKNKIFRTYSLEPALAPWTWGVIYRPETSRPAVLQFVECLRPLFKTPSHRNRKRS